MNRSLPIPLDEQQWPHPHDSVTVTQVSTIFGINRTTLAKPLASIRRNGSARTQIHEIETAARIFAEHERGARPSVPASLLIDALKIPAKQIARTPRPQGSADKERRYRVSKRVITDLYREPEAVVLGAYIAAHDEVVRKDTVNRCVRLAKIISVVIDRKIAVAPDGYRRIAGEAYEDFQKRVEADFKKHFTAFATLADWSAHAGPQDIRLFAFIEGKGRPLDFPLLRKAEWRRARLVFMNGNSYLSAMRKGLSADWAVFEQEKLGDVTGKPKKPGNGWPRA